MSTVLETTTSLAEVRAAREFQRQNQWLFLYPDTGPLRRELYAAHMEFFNATAHYREILVRFANQSGKSTAGAYAAKCFLTGEYPDWWRGREYEQPIKMWACAETAKKVREILQAKLFGSEVAETGSIKAGFSTGLIPGDCVGIPKRKSGVPDALDFIPIKHKNGWSKLVFKSFEEGWRAFESDVVDVIWIDEEPDEKIYAGCLMRTITKPLGLIYTTVTPLMGMTPFQLGFMGKAA